MSTPAPAHPWLAHTPDAAADALTATVLEILSAATWPDGSTLIDVDPAVLQRTVAPQINTAARVLAAAAILHGGLR